MPPDGPHAAVLRPGFRLHLLQIALQGQVLPDQALDRQLLEQLSTIFHHHGARCGVVVEAARLTQAREVTPVLHALCEETAHVLQVPIAYVVLIDPRSNVVEGAVGVGLAPDYASPHAPCPQSLRALRRRAGPGGPVAHSRAADRAEAGPLRRRGRYR